MKFAAERSNIARARGLSLQGTLFGIALALVSVMTVRIWRIELGLGMIPLIAVFLWPRKSSPGLSSVGVFLTGLMTDIFSGGPLGLWAIIFLLAYGALQPNHRARDLPILVLWPRFFGWVCAAVFTVIIIGAIFIPGKTAFLPFFLQALTAVLAFPFVYLMRQGLRQLVADPADQGKTS